MQTFAQPRLGQDEDDVTATAEQPATSSTPPEGPEGRRRRMSGPSPLLVVAAAFALGVALAKTLDRMGHGRRRR